MFRCSECGRTGKSDTVVGPTVAALPCSHETAPRTIDTEPRSTAPSDEPSADQTHDDHE